MTDMEVGLMVLGCIFTFCCGVATLLCYLDDKTDRKFNMVLITITVALGLISVLTPILIGYLIVFIIIAFFAMLMLY